MIGTEPGNRFLRNTGTSPSNYMAPNSLGNFFISKIDINFNSSTSFTLSHICHTTKNYRLRLRALLSVYVHLWASYTRTNESIMITNLTSSLLARTSSACTGTSLLAVLVVVVDFNFVVVIVVVCDVAVFDAVTLGLCVTSSLNKPLT
jgi:ubiquitin C-terminal hydrolase